MSKKTWAKILITSDHCIRYNPSPRDTMAFRLWKWLPEVYMMDYTLLKRRVPICITNFSALANDEFTFSIMVGGDSLQRSYYHPISENLSIMKFDYNVRHL